MSELATVTESEAAEDHLAKYWALIDFLGEHPEHQSSPRFGPFWHTFVYEEQVNNGGHLQYFHNIGTKNCELVIATLMKIGGHDFASILSSCTAKAAAEPVERVSSLVDYSEIAKADRFKEEDRAFYQTSPEVTDLLSEHFKGEIELAIGVRGA